MTLLASHPAVCIFRPKVLGLFLAGLAQRVNRSVQWSCLQEAKNDAHVQVSSLLIEWGDPQAIESRFPTDPAHSHTGTLYARDSSSPDTSLVLDCSTEATMAVPKSAAATARHVKMP